MFQCSSKLFEEQELWGTVPQNHLGNRNSSSGSSKSFEEQEHCLNIPQNYLRNRNFWELFLKIIWGTGTVLLVPQNHLKKRNIREHVSQIIYIWGTCSPMFLKIFEGHVTLVQRVSNSQFFNSKSLAFSFLFE